MFGYIEDEVHNAYLDFLGAELALSSAYIHWDAGEDHEAIFDLLSAVYRTINGCRYFTDWPGFPLFGINIFNMSAYLGMYFNWGMEDITAKMITDAWHAATHDELCDTICGIDFMRKEIWDEPNIKYTWAT